PTQRRRRQEVAEWARWGPPAGTVLTCVSAEPAKGHVFAGHAGGTLYRTGTNNQGNYTNQPTKHRARIGVFRSWSTRWLVGRSEPGTAFVGRGCRPGRRPPAAVPASCRPATAR